MLAAEDGKSRRQRRSLNLLANEKHRSWELGNRLLRKELGMEERGLTEGEDCRVAH